MLGPSASPQGACLTAERRAALLDWTVLYLHACVGGWDAGTEEESQKHKVSVPEDHPPLHVMMLLAALL